MFDKAYDKTIGDNLTHQDTKKKQQEGLKIQVLTVRIDIVARHQMTDIYLNRIKCTRF